MRAPSAPLTTLLLIAALGSCGGGQSISPASCEHSQGDSTCCSITSDCPANVQQFCAPPGASSGCGACNNEPETCTTDAECKTQGATLICVERTCACDAQRTCIAGCTSDATCEEGQTCDLTTNRCNQTMCVDDPDCPEDFSCVGSMCLRKGCITSSDCDAFCVEGLCYQSAGECRLPSA